VQEVPSCLCVSGQRLASQIVFIVGPGPAFDKNNRTPSTICLVPGLAGERSGRCVPACQQVLRVRVHRYARHECRALVFSPLSSLWSGGVALNFVATALSFCQWGQASSESRLQMEDVDSKPMVWLKTLGQPI
jgi:hypothetical protein